jgi:hypothetical protein
MNLHQPVLAIQSLIKQKDVAGMFKLNELEADALQELGFLLLQEGQLWESEEAFMNACKLFVFDQRSAHNAFIQSSSNRTGILKYFQSTIISVSQMKCSNEPRRNRSLQ